ncbi:MAG TPA: hypothetical protein DD379_06060, partial [Cyanobacteria bacterium UBA11162]|nr:hypothetical protein [Cyanobacteria bacterium UBA11162]
NQVFMNILCNAIDALESYNALRSAEEIEHHPSQIIISTEATHTHSIRVRIRDNGLGMSEAVQRHLFDPFFTTKPVGKGTGLGLSISYQIIVEKHQGKLECISASGEGTEFLIEIPVRQTALKLVGEEQKLRETICLSCSEKEQCTVSLLDCQRIKGGM